MTEKTEINQSDISNVLTAIFNGVEEENKASFELVASIPGVQKSVECVRKGDCTGFLLRLDVSHKQDGQWPTCQRTTQFTRCPISSQ